MTTSTQIRHKIQTNLNRSIHVIRFVHNGLTVNRTENGFLRQSVHGSEEGPNKNNWRWMLAATGVSIASCGSLHSKEQRSDGLDLFDSVVGRENVIRRGNQMSAYTRGMRVGVGRAVAIVKPTTINQAVQALQVAVNQGYVVICQGKNTSLTGGAVPENHNESRGVVILSMEKMDKVTPIYCKDGAKMLCMAGVGIATLDKLCTEIGRESHSILGSIFLNPSVAGGVAYGSGGTQIRKGPAYTERALYAKVDANGNVVVCDNTGIKASNLEELYRKIETGDVKSEDVDTNRRERFWCSSYPIHVTHMNNDVSRFNADSDSRTEVARSEGKVLILATIHQTFPAAKQMVVRWISTDNMRLMECLREKVCLGGNDCGFSLPSSFEYMNKEAIDGTLKYGKFGMAITRAIGVGNLGGLYALQRRVDSLFGNRLSNYVLYICGKLVPSTFIIPKSVVRNHRIWDRQHHLLMASGEYGGGELAKIEDRYNKFMAEHGGEFSTCQLSGPAVKQANMFRFNMASAHSIMSAVRGHRSLCLDYVLPKNHQGGFPLLGELKKYITANWIYSHFGCYVIHHDLALKKQADYYSVKHKMQQIVEGMNGQLPSEHGMGHLYAAGPKAVARLQRLDPLNVLNPGVGCMPYGPCYGNVGKIQNLIVQLSNSTDATAKQGLIDSLKQCIQEGANHNNVAESA